MFWFILGAIGFGVLCALGSGRRQYVTNNYYTNDGYVETDGDSGGGYCDGGRDE